jgi:hypothetical protein
MTPNPLEPVLFEVKRTIVGQDVLLERMAIAMLAGGHLLARGDDGDALLAECDAESLHRGRKVRPDRNALGAEFGQESQGRVGAEDHRGSAQQFARADREAGCAVGADADHRDLLCR